jgi:MYXO-CTERM domain-containing protein
VSSSAVRTALAVLPLALAGLLCAPSARAYCRTTSTPVPAGYDPTVHGCWTQGKPLAWKASRAPYGVSAAASNQVSLADATRIADLAFDAWNSASCPDGAPNVQAYDDGPVSSVPEASDCSNSNTCDAATHDVIVFDDAMWPHDDPANTLALTTVTFGVEDGAIFEAYTEVNSTPSHPLTTQEPPPAGSATYDLQAILTHEAGHFLGLAHAADTTSIMYAYYKPGRIELTSDDVAGLCAIYPQPSKSSGCAAAPGTDGGGAGLMLAGLALAAALRCRRR